MIAGDVDESEEIDSGPAGTEGGGWVEDGKYQVGLIGCGIDGNEMLLEARELGVWRTGPDDTSEALEDRDDDLLLACRSRVSKDSIRLRRTCISFRVIDEMSTSVEKPELIEEAERDVEAGGEGGGVLV